MFTRTRLAVIAGLVFVALAGALLLLSRPSTAAPVRSGVLGLSTSGPPGSTPQSSPAADSSPAATTPAPAATSDATNPTDPSASTTTSTTTTHSGGTTSGTPNCTSVARSATLQAGSTAYRQGDTVQATTTITNHGSSCKLTNNTVTANFLTSGGAVVHTQTAAATSATTWSSGQTLSATLTWTLQTCSSSLCSSPAPGTYTVSVTWPGVNALRQSFTVDGADTCSASDVRVGMVNVPSSAPAGSNVVIDGTLTNISGHTCAVAEATSLIIKDAGGNVVFSTGMGASSNSQTWNNGQALSFPYTWNQSTRGTYQITFTDNTSGVTVGPLTITLT